MEAFVETSAMRVDFKHIESTPALAISENTAGVYETFLALHQFL